MQFLTYTHILAGALALIVAPMAMAVVKGGEAHRSLGKLFFWSMTWIFISAIILSLRHHKPFLLMVSVLSYYLVVSGYRTLYHKQLSSGKGVRCYDWFAAIATGLFMLYFFVWGIYLLIMGAVGANVVLLFLFSIGGLVSVYSEVKAFLKPPADKNRWLYNHIGRMVGGFIATVTAFSVNVLLFVPGVWQWIWPALMGTPFIIYWIRIYKRRVAEGVRLSDLLELRK